MAPEVVLDLSLLLFFAGAGTEFILRGLSRSFSAPHSFVRQIGCFKKKSGFIPNLCVWFHSPSRCSRT